MPTNIAMQAENSQNWFKKTKQNTNTPTDTCRDMQYSFISELLLRCLNLLRQNGGGGNKNQPQMLKHFAFRNSIKFYSHSYLNTWELVLLQADFMSQIAEAISYLVPSKTVTLLSIFFALYYIFFIISVTP